MIEAVVLFADALRRAGDGEALASAPIGWFDLRSMWMTDLLDVEIVAVINETIDAERRETIAIVNVTGRAYLVESVDWKDAGIQPVSTVMTAR